MSTLEQAIRETVEAVYEFSGMIARFIGLRMANDDDEAFKVAEGILEVLCKLKAYKDLKILYDAILHEFRSELNDVVVYYKEHKES